MELTFKKLKVISWVGYWLLCLYIHRSSGIECGNVNVINDLIRGGNETVKGAWPFAVTLYEVNRSEPSCGGTLISKKHVLTAAHCIHNKQAPLQINADDLKVYLGVHNLSGKDDVGVVQANIEDIRVHPEWDPYFTSDFKADLAIIVLSENVSFTKTIRPVCLPADSADVNSQTIDLKGMVVGWDVTGSNNWENIQRQASITAVNDTYCYHKDEAASTFSSDHTFCGGFGDGYPTSGDSGGGYFVLQDKTWVQYGIISVTRTNRTGHALPSSIQIYTNLRSFKRWIVTTVKETWGEIGEAIEKIKIICDYVYQDGSYYGCIADAVNVQTDNIEIESVTGSHMNDNSNQNVEYLTFLNGSLIYLPHGIGNFFTNLRTLQVGPGLGTKRVTRSYFRNMTNLDKLQFFENSIDTLEEDSLWDLENLEIFQLFGNQIVELKENFFEKNEKLQTIFLDSNKLQTLPKHLLRRSLLLTHIEFQNNHLHLIDEKTFETNARLQYIDLSSNRLETLPTNLFKNNLLLKILSIANNLLKTVDEKCFHSNINLVSISLSSNQLEHLTGNMFKNNLLLGYVFLRNNSIKTMDKGFFERNMYFETIDLSLNQFVLPTTMETPVPSGINSITAIEEGLSATNVKTIDLSFNFIEYLPNTLFSNNLMLVNVSMRSNSLKVIDENCFANNPNLILIELSSNELTYLPKKLFQNNLSLKYVSLCYNWLETVDVETFAKNRELVFVDLATNRLGSIPRNLFENNLLLEGISLRNNSLKIIDDNVFDTNINLQNIDLSSNQLEYLPKNLFQNNLDLKYVLLQFNQLRFIEIDFSKLRNVRRINVYENVCTDDPIFQRHYDYKLEVLVNGRYLELFQRALNYFCTSMKQL
ncbi:insulin-like growth factor-binding protein complex acid labile subunit [Bradysia coprophila]|uniref:insulin-like growth factor-binding protein complex acid labile subunit n=1 Tax=Bradysia coprophila TaxID=38358 RepID=UPI00187DCB6B|nr:insulin-like growth factor-binding protein complex acid labile subunit [Bradysia coprophila]